MTYNLPDSEPIVSDRAHRLQSHGEAINSKSLLTVRKGVDPCPSTELVALLTK